MSRPGTSSRRGAAAVAAVAAALALSACGSPSAPSPSAPSPSAPSPSAPSPSAPSPSASSTAAPSTAVAATSAVTAVAASGDVFGMPLDAVPASDGSATWFVASGPTGPGVFVAAGGTSRALVEGTPFRTPTGLALTADDSGLRIADAGADVVFAEPVGGGTPTEVAGTRGLRPRCVEVAGGQLYVTGIDPVSGSGAVFSLPVGGGPVRTLVTGLHAPEGIAVAPDGAVLVTDQPGSVLRVVDGKARSLASGVRLGSPAGLTLTADGSTLLVSSLAAGGTAQVLGLDPVSGHVAGVFDDVIGANRAAGGLHLAHHGTSAAWADVSRSGRVYRVETASVTLS